MAHTNNRSALATRTPGQLGGGQGARTYDQIISDLLAGRITRQQAMAELVALGTATGISRERATTLAQTALADTDSRRSGQSVSPRPAPRFDPTGDLGSGPVVSFGSSSVNFVPTPSPEFAFPPSGFPIGQLPEGTRFGEAVVPFEDARDQTFRGVVGNLRPQGFSPGIEGAFGRQFESFNPSFLPLLAFGDLPADTSFKTFVESNLGKTGGFDPQDVARRTAGLFDRDDLNPAERELRRTLLANPAMQFQLAMQSRLQGFAGPLAESLRRFGRRSFDRFQTNRPIDPRTGLPDSSRNPFLPAFFQAGGFGGLN